MAQKKRQTLKGYFEVGDIPTQQQYHDWIESNVMLSDDNSGSIQLTGSINLVGSNGNLTASQHISASGNVSAASFEPNVVTSGIVSSSGTTGTSSFGTEIVLDNNTGLQSLNSINLQRNIAYINTGNRLILGSMSIPTTIESSTSHMFLDSAGDIYIDSDTGNVSFKDNALTSITFNTTEGHITASGDISARGNISSSTAFIGNSYTPTASLHTSGGASQIIFENLPQNKPSITGSLWLSGSAGNNSKYLVVFTG